MLQVTTMSGQNGKSALTSREMTVLEDGKEKLT